MSDPALGLTMLMLIVVVIMMGFPTAFTLMGLGMFFGFYAFYNPAEHWFDNRVFDLMVQRTYGAMTNDVLISIPLFVLMGYVMERGALVDKMFYSIQLSFRRVARLARRRDADRLHILGHRQRPRGSRRRPDGGDRLQPDAARRLRREARLRSHHRWGHAGHFDPAFGDDHRLCGGGRPVRREALRGSDVSRLFPRLPVPRLRHRLGDDKSEDRPSPSRGANTGSGAGMDAKVSGSLFEQHAGRALLGLVLASPDEEPRRRWRAPHLLEGVQELSRHADPARADGAHPLARVVVRRHPSAGVGRRRGSRGPGAARRTGGERAGDADRHGSGDHILCRFRHRLPRWPW